MLELTSGITSYEALTVLLLHSDSLNVVHSEKWQTFHSKIYQFVGSDKGLLIVGSQNLTYGGLWSNFESSLLIPVLGSSEGGLAVQKGVDEVNWWIGLTWELFYADQEAG